MRKLLIICALCGTFLTGKAQNYTFSKADCRLEVYTGATLAYNLQLATTTWADVGNNLFEIKDGTTSISTYASQITNYTGDQIDSLKTQLTTWQGLCPSTSSFWGVDATSGITPINAERITLDSGFVARTELWAGDSLTKAETNGILVTSSHDEDAISSRISLGVENYRGEGWFSGLQSLDFSSFTIYSSGIDNADGAGLYTPKISVIRLGDDKGYLFDVDTTRFRAYAVDGISVHTKQVQITGDEDDLVLSATDFTSATTININKDGETTTHLDGSGDTSKLIIKTDVIRLDSDTAKIDGVLVMPQRIVSYTPTSESDGSYPVGTIAYDATYIYHKVTSVLWRRTAFGAGGW